MMITNGQRANVCVSLERVGLAALSGLQRRRESMSDTDTCDRFDTFVLSDCRLLRLQL